MDNKFDPAASTWDDSPHKILMAKNFANEIIKTVQNMSFEKALEYGCGTANVSFFLKDYFDSILLLDNSAEMLNQVENKIKEHKIENFHPRLLNLEKDSLDEKFNIIYTLLTLHHIGNVKEMISKFSQMLVPGGMLIIGDLEKEDGNFHSHLKNMDVHNGFDKEFLEAILYYNSFNVLNYKVFHQLQKDHTGKPKDYSLFALSALKY